MSYAKFSRQCCSGSGGQGSDASLRVAGLRQSKHRIRVPFGLEERAETYERNGDPKPLPVILREIDGISAIDEGSWLKHLPGEGQDGDSI